MKLKVLGKSRRRGNIQARFIKKRKRDVIKKNNLRKGEKGKAQTVLKRNFEFGGFVVPSDNERVREIADEKDRTTFPKFL